MTKVMIMAGGTGGHIFPAAAVAEKLVESGYQVRWLGSLNGMEGKLVPQMGYEFCGLPVTAWHGGRLRKLLAPINLLRAFLGCCAIFLKEKPSAVIGFGGYASAPGGVAAWVMRIPLILHEQNGVPGLTNKKLAAKASVVLQAFPNTFAEDYEVVGNPVRANLCEFQKPELRGLASGRALKLLVLGGSQGAQAINELVPQALPLCKAAAPVEIWHQAGKGKADECLTAYKDAGVEATVVEFIDDMKAAYEWCDLVVARSGAATVSELAAVGAYSILLPYPWHKDRQQFDNADWLKQAGAAEWYEQKDLTAEALAGRIDYWNKNRNELQQASTRSWQLGVRDSARRILKVVQEFLPEVAA
ncbi:undecaprenyldiphospho-muramoylpentapeptide beta-N-acetylglucosaminyltransferase [Reinekea marinisedimentorum]|uniref:UDP-N-acetylglucosamine--N-acetylmuramyl-(pentapeptide) pyrophosphoryl-undecaprenol N-acetylglucosamine transferase n=1 Tax=Reinekea marinisedimentorum TaxID=230495 RepID=A0A4R3I6V3_9GAMM|nr:undecaprenyldiphospho-muramoylpentapeptide beta-N-acetylglucosaminyltransferase [Reinekea marinisedimentorum]TCS41716.1 UDP-N-acetylglucosamine--N-acetylmuramyl-(pentapeptide) pyrophosphoryl-undecaprenol N-acetylglucosamine transferase [Reinekea marinisedimentorum]